MGSSSRILHRFPPLVFLLLVTLLPACKSTSLSSAYGIADEGYSSSAGGKFSSSSQSSRSSVGSSSSASSSSSAVGLFVYPKGAYSIWNPKDKLSSDIINNKGIVGLLLSTTWSDVQPNNANSYFWDDIDARLAEAAANNLKIVLKITASPSASPDWILNDPTIVSIPVLDLNSNHNGTYCDALDTPLFWDPVFHAKRLALIQAAGARYTNNPVIVGVMASFANFSTSDWNIPDKTGTIAGCNNVVVDQVKDWLDAGFTLDKMLSVGKDIFDTTATAFPHQSIKSPIGSDSAALYPNGGTSTSLAEAAVNYVFSRSYANRFYIQRNNFSTNSPLGTSSTVTTATPGSKNYAFTLLTLHQSGTQLLDAADNGPNNSCRQNGGTSPCDPLTVLQNSNTIVKSYNPQFIEYWKADGTEPLFYSEMVSVTRSIGGTPRP